MVESRQANLGASDYKSLGDSSDPAADWLRAVC